MIFILILLTSYDWNQSFLVMGKKYGDHKITVKVLEGAIGGLW